MEVLNIMDWQQNHLVETSFIVKYGISNIFMCFIYYSRATELKTFCGFFTRFIDYKFYIFLFQ